jgi:hypothetical protein
LPGFSTESPHYGQMGTVGHEPELEHKLDWP